MNLAPDFNPGTQVFQNQIPCAYEASLITLNFNDKKGSAMLGHHRPCQIPD